jgi:hypothetical protein
MANFWWLVAGFILGLCAVAGVSRLPDAWVYPPFGLGPFLARLRRWEEGRAVGWATAPSAVALVIGDLSLSHPMWPIGFVVGVSTFGGVGAILLMICRKQPDPRVAELSGQVDTLHRTNESQQHTIREQSGTINSQQEMLSEQARLLSAYGFTGLGLAVEAGGGSPNRVEPPAPPSQDDEGENL